MFISPTRQEDMRVSAAASAFLALTSAQAQPRGSIEGFWRNPSGTAIIGIASCGSSLCGKVAWASARGQREAATSTKNVVGTTVLTELRASGDHWSGSLFIPDDNIHVSAKLEVLGSRQLKLTGCGMLGLICRSQLWTRTDGALPRQD